jgi:hypothetical protein
LKGEPDIVRTALTDLPKKLDETYDRIFLAIPKDEWPLVRRVLERIIYYTKYDQNRDEGTGFPCNVLLDGVRWEATKSNDDTNNRFYDSSILQKLCGRLINVASIPSAYVSFAHYTVLEYLTSKRIGNGPTLFFAMYEGII